MEKVGVLSPESVRDIWKDETKDFTPWLTDNPDLLGEALGMDLRLEATEAVVGQCKADLVYVEDTTERRVVFENLFRDTDHDHLGKLLIYAAGLGATNSMQPLPKLSTTDFSWMRSINNMRSKRLQDNFIREPVFSVW